MSVIAEKKTPPLVISLGFINISPRLNFIDHLKKMRSARQGISSLNGLARASTRTGGNQRLASSLERRRLYSASIFNYQVVGRSVGSVPRKDINRSPVVLRSQFSTLNQWGDKAKPKKQEKPSEKSPEEAKDKEASSASDKDADKDQEQKEGKEESTENQKKKDKKEEEEAPPPPPPPPHGDKSPFAVFYETLQSEFKKSQEWQESTKQLGATAQQFTESPAVQKAREAYGTTAEVAGKVGEKTAETLGKTASAIGKGAAWTWQTPVVKAGRAAVRVTGEGVAKVTKPVRETKVYKDIKQNVEEVIDDGSSSRYGGFLERDERKKQREMREMKGSYKRAEKHEENVKYVRTKISLPPP